MKKGKKQQVLAWPPRDFQWIEKMGDMERLSAIYAKLESISSFFSQFNEPNADRPVMACDVYGYWFIIKDICNELSNILKVDHWTGEIGKKADEGEEE